MSDDECTNDSKLAASADRLRREFERWLEAALSQGGRALDAIGLRTGKHWMPAVDIVESADEITVEADLPGIDAEQVEVSLAGNMLTISGTAKPRVEREGDTVHLCERQHGEFSRSIPLPAAVDAEKVSATAANGVLTLRIGKAEVARKHRIRVVSASPSL